MPEERVTVKDILNPDLDISRRLIRNNKDLQRVVKSLKDNDYKIVLTQGVWDLIHEGHAKYLQKAKSYGDILIVGVDSDELTRRRKGPSRPIVPETERVKMLAHLRYVDILTIRGVNEGLGDLIKLIKPDTLIVSKSTKDFTKKMKSEYGPFCGKIADLQPQSETNTTARIRNLSIEGVEKLAGKIKKLAEEFIQGIKDGKE